MRQTLVSDIGGPVARTALQINPYLLESTHSLRRRAYENLMRSFLPGTDFLILVDAADAARTDIWIRTLDLPCKARLVEAPSGKLRAQGAWMRDAFLDARIDSEQILVATHTQRPAGQARWIADAAQARIETHDLSLEGGDCLVADDFWLVGAQAVRNSMLIPGRRCDAVRAVERLAALDGRPMHVAGYPRSREVDRDLRGAVASDLAQDWAHIDLVVSLTGRRGAHGAPILMVASPVEAPCREEAQAAIAGAPLDAMARHLQTLGFVVLRNPAPFAGNPRRIAPYCNVILQQEPDIVWLPQFADAGEAFVASDAANAALWESLGYRVIPVEGWGAFLGAKGAIRCATNVIARKPLVPG